MKTIALTSETMRRGSLVLVNATHPFAPESKPKCLPITPGSSEILLESRAASCLRVLIGSINGWDEIVPVSGYRSAAEQRRIYENSLLENGPEFTRKFVAPPGCSEHETGLAIDLAEQSSEIDYICPSFPGKGICQTLRDTASLYGFIQRYTKAKENITGIACEPWHFRFVGYPHAIIMNRLHLCLEEYISYLRQFPWGCNPLQFTASGRTIEIYWASGFGEIGLPDTHLAEVSGTNAGGHVITLWQ